MTHTTFVEQLCVSLPPLDTETLTQLRALDHKLPAQTLAWAVQRVVMLGAETAPPLAQDVLEVARALCVCDTADQLLPAWLRLYRPRKGLPLLDDQLVASLVHMSVIRIDGPEGFTSIAAQLGDDRVRLSTECKDHSLRPSTPPLVCASPRRGRVATPPSADVENAMK